MNSQAAENKAIEIVDKFMSQDFDEEAEARAWLVSHIARGLMEAERAGVEAARLSERRDR
ncbi:MAG: hypothetical protein WBX25_08360 [Rhodomicrobium sp.]